MKSWKIALTAAMLLPVFLVGSLFAQQPPPVAADTAKAVHGNTEFALDLYRRLAQKDEKENLFFSPYSISTALAMTYGGARGDTAKEMADTLHFGLEPNRLHPAFADLAKETISGGHKPDDKTPRKFKLTVANRLWGQKGLQFLPEFLALTERNYGAGLKEVDFIGATEQTRKDINAWVEKETNDKIKELLKPGILTSQTRLVLTNAIYFKAAWYVPFRPEATKPGPFSLAGGKKVEVPMMHGEQFTDFFDSEAFQALQMRYEWPSTCSMVIFLPRKTDGLAQFEKTLSAANLEKWLKQLSHHAVQVALPRFKVTAEFQLNDVLKEMGMKRAFGDADFSGMTKGGGLFISAVVHKAFVDVNETGTEAAAATAVAMATSEPPPGTFTADHPFVFVIRDNRTGSILFMGRVSQP